MRNVVMAMMVSLDGYVEGPNKQFIPPAWSDDMQRHWSDDNVEGAGTLMYGRVCYEGMAAFWGPAAADLASPMHAFAQR